MIDENDEIITMTYDDGTSENFFSLAELEYEGKWYNYLEPVDPPEDYEEGEVIVYEEATDENGEEIFLPVEDDDLLQKLVDYLNEEIEKA
ncbi:MAG: DUF1292 domain-containing protein [Clostridia bacterium]|nr:DUF1292 domain-containing protein [Clostridia bacterium]